MLLAEGNRVFLIVLIRDSEGNRREVALDKVSVQEVNDGECPWSLALVHGGRGSRDIVQLDRFHRCFELVQIIGIESHADLKIAERDPLERDVADRVRDFFVEIAHDRVQIIAVLGVKGFALKARGLREADRFVLESSIKNHPFLSCRNLVVRGLGSLGFEEALSVCLKALREQEQAVRVLRFVETSGVAQRIGVDIVEGIRTDLNAKALSWMVGDLGLMKVMLVLNRLRGGGVHGGRYRNRTGRRKFCST